MTAKEKARRAAASVALDGVLKYIKKSPEENFVKMLNLIERFADGIFPEKNFDAFRKAATDKNNVWHNFAMGLINDLDLTALKKMLLAIGLGAAIDGTKKVRANREKYKCNIPFIILLDPTSACNLNCKGCWSAQYGNRFNLSLDDMRNIVAQGTELGTHFYMFTGGEPLIRKSDILTLCEENPDCGFLAYTNASFVDEKFCEDMKQAGNLTLALSVEGTEYTNDARRGEGSYERSMKAMELLRKHGLFFGLSVCYTAQNVDAVTSDEFLDKMIANGAKFALYFNYMPVGKDAVESLIPTPEQRTFMYNWLRKMRNGETGKPIFVMDFQDDGEYVGGCIAGGRNYFHINSAGDMEPCVFIHYADSNIHTDTILEALQKPLFRAYWHNQPFNENHLRPCPLLENPQCLRKIISETGAKSTNLEAPEDVETLCSRCDKFAKEWQPIADELWASREHPNPKTQYYRDMKTDE